MAIQSPFPWLFRRVAIAAAGCTLCAATLTAGSSVAPTLSTGVVSHSEQGLLPTADLPAPQVTEPGFVVQSLVCPPESEPAELCGGCAALSALGPFGTDITYVADTLAGEVARMTESDPAAGAFLVGLSRPTSVALPIVGPWAGAMLVKDGLQIWIVRPLSPGDFDGDGHVTGTDLVALLQAWGPCPNAAASCVGDLDGSRDVDAADLAVLLSQWG